jgi:hypothetical protein
LTFGTLLVSGKTTKLAKQDQQFPGLRRAHKFPLSSIINVDETPMYFDMPMNCTLVFSLCSALLTRTSLLTDTIDKKGTKEVRVRTKGKEKERLTVVLGASAAGDKLNIYTLVKRKTDPTKLKVPPGMIVVGQENGYMDEKHMLDYIERILAQYKPVALEHKTLLVIDAFKAHLSDKVKARIKGYKAYLAVIPAGFTSIFQPLDLGINRSMKAALRKRWNDWMINGKHELTKKGNPKKAPLELVLQWVHDAWQGIRAESIVNSFKHAGLSNALDGSEDALKSDAEADTDANFDDGVFALEEDDDE